jgi:hypothetical protein
MADDDVQKRLLQLEIAVATLASDFRGHVVLCNGRWNVIWKLAAAMSGLIALVVSAAVAMITRS